MNPYIRHDILEFDLALEVFQRHSYLPENGIMFADPVRLTAIKGEIEEEFDIDFVERV